MTIVQKIFFYMMLLVLASCGYEPLYSKKDGFNLDIKSFQVEGNKSLSNKIISSLNLKNQLKATGLELIINTNKTLEAASKDAAGNTSVYKTKITVNISLLDGDKIFRSKDFSSEFTYNNIENKFDLSEYQKDIEKNLINKVIEEIYIFLTI